MWTLVDKPGASFQGDWLVAFLAWIALASLIADLLTTRRLSRVLITIVVALLGTAITILPGLAGYWWIIAILALLFFLLQKGRIRRLFLCIRMFWKLMRSYDKYAEPIETVVSDRWEKVKGDILQERDRLAKQNLRIKGIINHLARDHRQIYKVREDLETRIESDGTSHHHRTTEVIATTETVRWVVLRLGTTTPNPEGQGIWIENLEFFDGQGRKLEHEFYEDFGGQTGLIVFLREPVKVGGPSQKIQSSARMKHSWVELVEKLEDYALHDALGHVEKLTYTLKMPPTLRLAELRVEPRAGNTTIPPDGFSGTWSASNLPPDSQYRLYLRCLRAK